MLKRITKTRLSQVAVEQIREMIISQELEPGSKLPSERQLTQALGISRASVREALRILEIMGLIEVKPGSGIFVKELTGDVFLPLSSWLPTHKETLHDHFETRQVIEPRAAAFAAERASPEIIRSMKDALADFSKKAEQNDLVGLILSDIEFHRLIAQATGNKTLTLLMQTIARFLPEGWKASLRIPSRVAKTIVEHRAILEAIERGEPDTASQAMSQHLKNAVDDLAEAGLD